MVTIQLTATVKELRDFVVVIAPNLLEAYQEIGVPFRALDNLDTELFRVGMAAERSSGEDEAKLRKRKLKTLEIWESLLRQIPDTEPTQG